MTSSSGVENACEDNRELLLLLLLTCGALIASGVSPFDRGTWLMEVAPVFIGVPLLWATFRRFRLTPLLYRLIFLHALILILGGHYTYAQVPLGFWMQEVFDFSRNHYDRLGHIAQGFIPAILSREILIRTSALRPGRWLFFICVSICLAFSAFYELLEWWAAASLGKSADAFLGTQGDMWDTQWDMFMALCGACLSLSLLGSLHTRALKTLGVFPQSS